MRRPGGAGRLPLLLAVPAVVTVGLVLLPLAYLALRAGTGGSEAWSVLDPGPTARLVLDTALLVAAV
ncbi:MAG: iron ABC transporter permease, partial [Actinobacteria bacterium]|nr:iron ABC transporter permease [Actinomycetota bacterium]